MVVAATLIVFIAVGIWKPWQPPVSNAAATPLAVQLTQQPDQAGAPRQSVNIDYLGEPETLSLDDVRTALADAATTASIAAVLPGKGEQIVSAALSIQRPTTQKLGPGCAGAPVVPLGHAAFGLTVPDSTTAVSVARLFATGSPLPVSTESTIDSKFGVALISLRQTSWPVGHYAVVLTAARGTSYVPFCVSSNVPASADAPAARFELWDPAQP